MSRDSARFRDPDGREWVVLEVGAPDGPCLVFVSETGVRRARHYPGNWSTLPATELYALSRAA